MHLTPLDLRLAAVGFAHLFQNSGLASVGVANDQNTKTSDVLIITCHLLWGHGDKRCRDRGERREWRKSARQLVIDADGLPAPMCVIALRQYGPLLTTRRDLVIYTAMAGHVVCAVTCSRRTAHDCPNMVSLLI